MQQRSMMKSRRACSTSVVRPGVAGLRRPVGRTAASDLVSRAQQERFDPQVCVVLGTQWGDEGKGKLVDILAQQYDIVARAQV